MSRPASISKTTLRSSAVLTTSYVAANVIQVQNKNQAHIQVNFTIGAATDGRIKIEFSEDNSDFYQETYLDIAAGSAAGAVWSTPIYLHEYILPATGKYNIPVPINCQYIKISAKATTSAVGTLCSIYLVDGIV